MAIEPSEKKRIHVELTVLESQREELRLAWHEIVPGRHPRMGALSHEISAIKERTMKAVRIIEDAMRRNPTTDQARRLVWFMAAVYNGLEYLFDLTELRTLDWELADACLDCLNYDHLGRREVHRRLSRGDAQGSAKEKLPPAQTVPRQNQKGPACGQGALDKISQIQSLNRFDDRLMA